MEGLSFSHNSEIGFIRHINDCTQAVGDIDEENLLGMCEISMTEECREIYECDSESDFEEEMSVAKSKKQIKSVEEIYIQACKQLKAVACSPFLREIRSDEIDISHYNIGPNGAQAVARAMLVNTTTSLLNLSDNGIGVEGAIAVAGALTENCFITVLDLSVNFIDKDGAKAICAMLKCNKYLLELSLASNRLSSASAVLIADALKDNHSLRVLNLSSNDFEDSQGCLAAAISCNTGLLYLDLSGNHIRNDCASGLFDALAVNSTLRFVDLSSNGLADNVSVPMKNMLKTNSTLRDLDLSRNRFTGEAAKSMAIGLEKNTGLRVFRISGNPIRSRGATLIIQTLIGCADSLLEELYMNGIDVSVDFEKAKDELLQHKSLIYVEYGTIFKGGENRRRVEAQKDLVSRILDFIEFRGIRVVDFFRSMDKHGRLMITKIDFKKGLETAGIPVRSHQLDQLFQLLDVEGSGYAQYSDFVKFIQKDFRHTFAKTRRNHQWNH